MHFSSLDSDDLPLGVCKCESILDPNDPSSCASCSFKLPQIVKLNNELIDLKSEVTKLTGMLKESASRENKLSIKLGLVQSKLSKAESALEEKMDELSHLKHDLEVLGEKLTDALEQRAELIHSKEAVNDEIEDLTRNLFEEANNLVANEAKQKLEHQQKGEEYARKLAECQLHLQVEQTQLRELRVKYANMENNYEKLAIKMKQDMPRSMSRDALTVHTKTVKEDDLIDPVLFQQFKEVAESALKVKFTRIHSLLFMQNALEDEVIPCLRFGGNPKTSTKKFIDAIISNTCFIEEMSQEIIQKLLDRDRSVDKQEPTSIVSPNSIFSKTVLERFTQAISITEAPEHPGGCSTCGKTELYKFRFKISDVSQEIWCPICINCRERLLAVCDFYQFIRNLRQGVYSSTPLKTLYVETVNLKRNMFYVRTGAKPALDNPGILNRPLQMNSTILSAVSTPGSASMNSTPNLEHQI